MRSQGNDISFSQISLFFFLSFPPIIPSQPFPPTHLPELQLWPPGPILWINTLFTRQTPPITTDTLFWITTIWPKCSPFLSWRCPEDTTMLHRLIIQSRCWIFEKSKDIHWFLTKPERIWVRGPSIIHEHVLIFILTDWNVFKYCLDDIL